MELANENVRHRVEHPFCMAAHRRHITVRKGANRIQPTEWALP